MNENKILNKYEINDFKCNKSKLLKIAIIFFFPLYFLIKRNANEKQFNINKNSPKISIFLPIFNKSKYLRRSITSIQKQTLKDIEILAVNDGSTDNSLDILKEMSEKDPRIKIINQKNRGSLFSRANGILNSKGEYLMSLDPDDEYRGKNSFKFLYDTAKDLNVDFISFFILYLPEKKKSKQFSKFGKILKQPELFQSAFSNNYLNDFYITNKFIKRELLEKAFKSFKNKIYGEKWNYHEDNIWSILVYKNANSSVFVNKVIYYYHQNSDSVMFNRGNLLEIKNLLYRNEMYEKIFKAKEEEKYIITGYLELIDIFDKNIETINSNDNVKNSCFKELNNFKNYYNISEEIIKRTDILLSKLSNF